MTFESDIPILMKRSLLLFCLSISILLMVSCKKIVKQQEQNAILNIMTHGVWAVTNYSQVGVDITSSFSGYTFQFHADGSVAGLWSDSSRTGTWVANVNAHSITSNFPNSGDPLDKLNAVWIVTDSYIDSVSAYASLDSGKNYLSLKKQ
jgi:hypothetical protein